MQQVSQPQQQQQQPQQQSPQSNENKPLQFLKIEKGEYHSTEITIVQQLLAQVIAEQAQIYQNNYQAQQQFNTYLTNNLTQCISFALQKNQQGAIYVSIHETQLHLFLPTLLQMTTSQANNSNKPLFKFHRYLNNHYTYYTWNNSRIEDKVPDFASSIEGVQGFILSPDEQEVLLVKEHNMWKGISGAIKSGDGLVESLVREAQEEVGVKIDLQGFEPRFVGAYHTAKSRYGVINNNFHCMVVRAVERSFTVDNVEIFEAQWFKISGLQQIVAQCVGGAQGVLKNKREYKGFSAIDLIWLYNYSLGKYYHAKQVSATKLVYV